MEGKLCDVSVYLDINQIPILVYDMIYLRTKSNWHNYLLYNQYMCFIVNIFVYPCICVDDDTPVVGMVTYRKEIWPIYVMEPWILKKHARLNVMRWASFEIHVKIIDTVHALLCFLVISYRRILPVSHHIICGYFIITGSIRIKWSNPEAFGYSVKISSLDAVSWIYICFVDGMWLQMFIVFNHIFTL